MREMRADACGGKAGVFVHGYNHSFQEALYRLVQMRADAQGEECAVLFSWPSSARARDYLGDRDSADFSRQALVSLMADLARDQQIGTVTIFAHSMGARLTMEALRQLRLLGQEEVLDRLEVILVAPDIDLDVFQAQASLVGPMKTPMVVLVAADDRALQLSQRLSGSRPRLGTIAVEDPRVSAAANAFGIQIIDIADLPAGRFGHDRYIALSVLHGEQSDIEVLDQVRSAGTFVFDTIENTLEQAASVTAN